MTEIMVEYLLAFSFIALFGSLAVVVMTFAWSLFEDTELGQILIKKVRSWFGSDEE